MSNLPRVLEVLQRRRERDTQAQLGLPATLWSDAHARALATLIPNPALLPCVARTTDAQDEDGNFLPTVGWDDIPPGFSPTADTTLVTADSTLFTADMTTY